MLPREILKIWALRNAISCILSHFMLLYGIFLSQFLTIISKQQQEQPARIFPFLVSVIKPVIYCRYCAIKFDPPHVSQKWKIYPPFKILPPSKTTAPLQNQSQHLLYKCWTVYHCLNLHNTKSWISLEREKISRKGKGHLSSFLKVYQIHVLNLFFVVTTFYLSVHNV